MDKKIIDNIVWWIPIKKYRDYIRNYFYNIEYLSEKIKEIDKLNIDKINKIHTIIDKTTPRANIIFIEIHLVEHCNLNCQGCTHFSQLADKEFLDIKDFEQDIKRLYELSNGEIDRFNLMVGEPLLHPNCEAFFEVTRKYFKNSIIQLVTNGVLLLKKEKTFWESMKNNDITLAPTKYPINVDWEKVDKLCQEYGIKFKFFNNVNFDKFSWKFPINFNGTENPNWNFRNCGLANWCLFLDHGKLYTCTLPPVIRHFNKFFNKNIPVSNNDYIDIYKTNNYQEILQFLAKPIPFCKYCDVKHRKHNLPWKTSTKTIDEYTN